MAQLNTIGMPVQVLTESNADFDGSLNPVLDVGGYVLEMVLLDPALLVGYDETFDATYYHITNTVASPKQLRFLLDGNDLLAGSKLHIAQNGYDFTNPKHLEEITMAARIVPAYLLDGIEGALIGFIEANGYEVLQVVVNGKDHFSIAHGDSEKLAQRIKDLCV